MFENLHRFVTDFLSLSIESKVWWCHYFMPFIITWFFILFLSFICFLKNPKKNCKTNNKKIQKKIFLMYLHRFWHFNAFTKRIKSLKIYFRHVQFLTCIFKNHWLFFFYWEDIDITFFFKKKNSRPHLYNNQPPAIWYHEKLLIYIYIYTCLL